MAGPGGAPSGPRPPHPGHDEAPAATEDPRPPALRRLASAAPDRVIPGPGGLRQAQLAEGTIKPWVWVRAFSKRSCTSAQLTMFQNALT